MRQHSAVFIPSISRLVLGVTSAIALLCISAVAGEVSDASAERTIRPSTARSLFSRRLTTGRGINVRANRCQLEFRRNNTSRIRLRCVGSKGPAAPRVVRKNTQLLRSGDSVTIAARGCFLTIPRSGPNRVRILCSATEPSPTPTPTPTPGGPTATPTTTPTPTSTPTPNANALVETNQLVTFNTSNAAGAPLPILLAGVTAGEAIVGIDRRPQNGVLYGLGYQPVNGTVQLYAVNPESHIAVPIGVPQSLADGVGTAVRIGVDATTQFGVDFNPAVDRLRVVASNGQNFRMNPNTGEIIDTDGGVTGNQPDGAISGLTGSVQGAAYTNNGANAPVTTLYSIDAGTDSMYIQNPANAGTQTNKILLNTALDAVRGFDIPPATDVVIGNAPLDAGTAFAVLRPTGTAQDLLAQIDLVSGVVSPLGALGSTQTGVLGMSIQQPVSGNAVALTSDGSQLWRFRLDNPRLVLAAVVVSGIDSGETLVGIDYRPSTGVLMGLGVDPAADDGTLYRIDPQTGAASAIGAAGSVSFVESGGATIDFPAITASSGYGFDFNPAADLIRVVTSTGLNFRINPNTGTGVDSDAGSAGTQPDTAINGATTSAAEAAYTNSYAQSGTTVTTLYAIDAASDSLSVVTVPNGGTTNTLIPMTLGGSTLDFSAAVGFDIPSDVRASSSNASVGSGAAYALLTTGPGVGLYTIDLVSGVARNVGLVGAGGTSFRGIAVSRVQAQ